MVCATHYLQNEFGDPRFFFTFLILSYHSIPAVKVLKKSVCGRFLGANALNYGKRFVAERASIQSILTNSKHEMFF